MLSSENRVICFGQGLFGLAPKLALVASLFHHLGLFGGRCVKKQSDTEVVQEVEDKKVALRTPVHHKETRHSSASSLGGNLCRGTSLIRNSPPP